MAMKDVQLKVKQLQDEDRQHVWHPLTQHRTFRDGAHPLIITDGEGSVVRDIEGREFLDAAAGLWCVNVGYGRQELVDAATKQMSQLAYYPLTQSNPAAIELSSKIASFMPYVPYLYYSNSGSEANEMAFKTVRQYWKQVGKPDKMKIISRYRGYHGTTLGALAATGQPQRKRDYGPLPAGFVQVAAPYCYRCPFHLAEDKCGQQCALDFERRINIEDPETVAAIIVEPIIAGGGVLVPPEGYLRQVAEIARKYDVKLIVDEVVTGFGRTGDMFAHTAYGVQPDVVTMAKGLASGYMPIGATAVSEEIFEAFFGTVESGNHLRHVNTYGGHPVACAVALANIKLIEKENLVTQSKKMGSIFLNNLKNTLKDIKRVGDIRGKGLLVGIELVLDSSSKEPVSDGFMRLIAKHLLNAGIIAGKATDVESNHNNILMFAPPLVITEKQIEKLTISVKKAIAEIGEQEG